MLEDLYVVNLLLEKGMKVLVIKQIFEDEETFNLGNHVSITNVHLKPYFVCKIEQVIVNKGKKKYSITPLMNL